VEISNNYTADTSKTRVAGSVSYDYLFGLPQSLSFQYQTSPEEPDEVRVLAATWMLREQGSRNSWAFYAVDSNSDVATLGSFNVLGAGRIFGARRMLGFSPDAAPFTGLTFGLDYKDFREDILARDTPAATTPISYLLLSATANSHHEGDRWQVNSELSFSAGLRNLFNSESEFAYKRYLTHGTFAYLRGRTSISRSLPNGFAATLRINAQLAAEPLISNEQFSLGGAESVRGYLEAEALADRGMQFSLEFMAPPLTLLHTKGTPWLTALPYVFGDFGFGETIQPLPRQDPSVHLASVGAGLHFGGQGPVSASAQLARTLLAGARTTEDRWRFLFLLGVSL
jgi:hemolysin activation/secretion protein